MRMAECHPDRVHQAFGLCSQCYLREYDKRRGKNRHTKKDPSEYAPNYRKPPSKPRRNADCHPERPHVALGLCNSCYQQDRADRPRAECHPDRPLVANGKCGMCLSRKKYWDNPEKYQEQSRRNQAAGRKQLRDQMVAAYGGKCSCLRCPETNPAFLTLEHVNGTGKEHRAVAGSHTYADLRRRGWPKDGYTLLCWNCNAMTRWGRTCPHMEGA